MTDPNNEQERPFVSDWQRAFDAGMRAAEARESADGAEYVVVPDGAQVESLEHLADNPYRIRGVATLDSAADLVAYANRHKMRTTVVYAQQARHRVVVVLNDDADAENPGWRDHRAVYECPLDRDWQAWAERNRKEMDQRAFADHLESLLPTIAEPPGADLVELVQRFEAKLEVTYTSGQRLDDGTVQLEYQETIEGRGDAQRGNLLLPPRLTIAVPVYRGQEPVTLLARIRYRIQPESRELRLQYVLDRPEEHLDAAFEAVVAEVRDGLNPEGEGWQVPVLLGTPPDARA